MATKSENSDIAVLQTQMGNVVDTVKRIENKLDMASGVYLPISTFEEFKKRWILSHTLAATVPSLLTGLIVYFLTHGS